MNDYYFLELAEGKGKGEKEKGKKIEHFSQLDAWQLAHQLTLHIYSITKEFPSDEKYGLTSQIRRAAVSVESNIAEGFTRFHSKDKKQFYIWSKSSCVEVECQLILANDLKYISQGQYKNALQLCSQAQKSITGLIQSMNKR